MGLKTVVNQIFTDIKTNFTPTKTIKNYVFNDNLVNSNILPCLSFFFNDGYTDQENTYSNRDDVNIIIDIELGKSKTLQDDVLEMIDEFKTFIKQNPRIGGSLSAKILSYQFGIDGLQSGHAIIKLTSTIQS